MNTADILRINKQYILENWLEKLRTEIPVVKNYDKTAIENGVPHLIDSIIEILNTNNSEKLSSHSVDHGWQRSQHKAYTMKHIIKEYNLLRTEIFKVVDENSEITSRGDRDIIIDAVNYAIEQAAEAFYNEKQSVQVNARKLAEMKADQLEIEEKNKEEFIQSIVHDLNSPLNNIIACIEMLEGNIEIGEAKKVLEILRASSHQAELLIEDFLDVGSVGAYENLPLNINRVNILDELEHQIKIYKISYRREIELNSKKKEIVAELDVNLIRRAFNNLMNNALKHGLPSKPISIECNQNNGFLSISVHNESKKIPEDILNSIFNRYYKVKDSTKGWGIGLAFVKKVAEAHGGKVLVDSTSKGTTFILEIPVVSGSRQ
jgi:signal transduction histidine kinase